MENNYGKLINEGGEGYNPNVGNSAQQGDRERAAIEAGWAKFDSEWTMEALEARRTAWNTAIRAGEATAAGKVDAKKLASLEKRMGFTARDLSIAKSRLGVK